MKKKPTVQKWGDFDHERCPNCGKFANREDAFHDRKDRSDDCSPILRFCNERCADKWAAFREDIARRATAVANALTSALRG